MNVDTLMRRGWAIVNECSLCKESEESADQILIHCDKINVLWKFKGQEKRKRVVGHLVPICLFWCIWGECH